MISSRSSPAINLVTSERSNLKRNELPLIRIFISQFPRRPTSVRRCALHRFFNTVRCSSGISEKEQSRQPYTEAMAAELSRTLGLCGPCCFRQFLFELE